MTTTAENDPILRIGSLKAATSCPQCVNPSTPLKEAMQKMTEGNYSQLPVVEGKGSVGQVRAISWKSIGEWIAAGNAFSESARVEECTQEAEVVPTSKPLLEVCEHIAEYDFVLVCDENQAIIGIVTAADLSGEFMELTEAFLLIGQIERNLRILMNDILPVTSAKSNCDEWVPGLGHYSVVLDDKKNWTVLNLDIDQSKFVNCLKSVRKIRGSIMHFKQKETSENHIAELREFSHWLDELVTRRST